LTFLKYLFLKLITSTGLYARACVLGEHVAHVIALTLS